jgi:glutathione S-transferase
MRIADTSIIIDHLKRTRGIDPDAGLDASQRATALLVQRTLEEHYAFVAAYTHLLRDAGVRYTRARFDSVPLIVRPLIFHTVQKRIRNLLWQQGILRHADEDIIESGVRDWRAVLAVMSDGPFFFGNEPTSVDAIVFGALATTVLTPIESPIRDFLRSRPGCVAYAERMRERFFPEIITAAPQDRAA